MLILLSHVFHHSDEVLIGHEVSGSSSGRELEFSSAIRFTYTRIVSTKEERWETWVLTETNGFGKNPVVTRTGASNQRQSFPKQSTMARVFFFPAQQQPGATCCHEVFFSGGLGFGISSSCTISTETGNKSTR